MTKIQELERRIKELSHEDLSLFRKWFAEFDAQEWDNQIEKDILSGKFEKMAQKALKDHADGKTIKI